VIEAATVWPRRWSACGDPAFTAEVDGAAFCLACVCVKSNTVIFTTATPHSRLAQVR
jgi:hypothetical protein